MPSFPGCTLSTGLIPVDAGPDPSLTSLCVQPAHWRVPCGVTPSPLQGRALHKLLVILQGLLSPALSGPSSSPLCRLMLLPLPQGQCQGWATCAPWLLALLVLDHVPVPCCCTQRLDRGPSTLSCQFLPALPSWLAAPTPTGPEGVPTESFSSSRSPQWHWALPTSLRCHLLQKRDCNAN